MDNNINFEQELDNLITLCDENGKDVTLEFLDLIEFDGNEYVVLFPTEEEDNTGEVIILQAAENDNPDEEGYLSVEDEEILNKVFEIFKEKFKDHFNFI